jgi:hypothetical protein
VISDDLPWIHFEVKAVEKLNVQDAMDQARRDAGTKIPVVAHKRSFREWLVTMTAEVFFRFLRGDFTGDNKGDGGPTRTGQEGTTNEREIADQDRNVPPDIETNLGPQKVPATTTNKKKEANEDKE